MSKGVYDLVEAFQNKCNGFFFRNQSGQCFVEIKTEIENKILDIDSKDFKSYLVMIAVNEKLSFSQKTISTAQDVVRAKCEANSNTLAVYNRVGKFQKKIVINLAQPARKYVVIDSEGYRTSDMSPIPFVSQNIQMAMPDPKEISQAEFYSLFKKICNYKDPDMALLVMAFVIKSNFVENGAFPILIFEGKQGSGKSVSCKRIKYLIDPSMPPLLSPPKDEEKIRVQISSRYLLSYDNLSGMSNDMSDIFCRIATGVGFSCRTLYTTNEETFLSAHCPVVLNGIDEPTIRADFIERSLLIELSQLTPTDRKTEADLNNEFERNYPYLLGGLYALTSKCLKFLPTITSKDLPRMADFAKVGIALEKALKLPAGEFLRIYNKNLSMRSENAFWDDAVCVWIYSRLNNKVISKREIIGTASSLLAEMAGPSNGDKGGKPRFQSPKALSSHLRRVEPLLNERGIFVEHKRTGDKREIFIYYKNCLNQKSDANDGEDEETYDL